MELTFPYRETWIHRVNPGIKLAVSALMFVVVLFVHNFNAMANLSAGSILLLYAFSGHPPKRLLLYTAPFLLIFISSTTGMAMFGEGETTWFQYGLIHITEESFYRGLHLGFRALAVAALGLSFGLTTKPADLFYSLMQQWKLPPKYAYSFLAALRMVPAIVGEFQTRRHALTVRGRRRRFGIAGWYDTLQLYSIPILAQSIRRAHRVAVAMEAKRFTGSRRRTYYYTSSYSLADLTYLYCFALWIGVSLYAGTAWPYVDVFDVR